ncbi:asparagine synthase (glutamine-hydrolyzing) [Verrucomicrobiaceae bacterium 5K15]|uniref:asparagine synthase (glutamine-hydrolyzing) n=1 Tax=Oceaniferula flava TaxID=2800421 RepID=A0AAE2SDM5_9BACT|nr:asparagine synthase (glutamine-hydrolyzing) [Oceaniferula flavus]MBK1854949.1 asparagine synthase (glutamine-hydrolyzing) [Oceaniferula flavus]MBM1136255.1 asparagine synthase (glutamine-hydrolyzing) [Oceaniferula flavus]
MCGIAGHFSSKPLPSNTPDLLEGQLKTLYHRGPDGNGQYVDRGQGVALGHTRLAINDLEGGCQPLHAVDGRYVLTSNGEFYDFKQHRATLMAEGDRFYTKSDSEIAIGLYRKFGLDFTEHLRGEFAFALYDKSKDELILLRDRFGVRPLFYWLSPDQTKIVYGSEVKSILAHPDVPAKLDGKAALHQLMQTIAPGMSAFENIVSLDPGHFLRIRKRDGKLEILKQKYWDYDFPCEEDRPSKVDEQEHVEHIREELIRAIVLRLEADVPVGCYLSGGIDSCCILGLATGAMQSPTKAYTISFDDDAYDEAPIAKQMAESMGADQEVINLRAADLYGENYVKTVWHCERTFYNTLGVAKNLMSKRVWDSGYRCVITGEGADELFAGYPALKRDMFLHGLAHEPESVRNEYQAALEKTNKLFKGAILAENQRHHPAWEKLMGFTPSWLQPWMDTLDLARPLLSDQLQSDLEGYDPIEEIASRLDPSMLDGRHPLDKAQYTWSKCQLEGQILNWGGDRVDMANSMESRPAFLDHHLAKAAVDVPPNLRIKGNVEKHILREAVKGVLPEVLYKREKFAFMAPPAHTDAEKRNKVEELISEYLNHNVVEEAGVCSPEKVDAFLTGYRQDSDPTSLVRKDTLLNHLITLHILHRQFVAL